MEISNEDLNYIKQGAREVSRKIKPEVLKGKTIKDIFSEADKNLGNGDGVVDQDELDKFFEKYNLSDIIGSGHDFIVDIEKILYGKAQSSNKYDDRKLQLNEIEDVLEKEGIEATDDTTVGELFDKLKEKYPQLESILNTYFAGDEAENDDVSDADESGKKTKPQPYV